MTQHGGTGRLAPHVAALTWSDPRRIAGVIAQAPDIVPIVGGQNGSSQSMLSLNAAVTTTLNAMQIAPPKALFVGIGGVTGANVPFSGPRSPRTGRARSTKAVCVS